MRNLLRPLAWGLTGSFLLGAVGFVVTSLAVSEWQSQFKGSYYALASASVRGARRCIEHPIERLIIQRFHIDELTPEQVSSARNGMGQGTLDDSGAALVRGDSTQIELRHTHRARVSAYTLFAIPIFTLSVTGSAPDLPGNCQRV